MAKTDNLKPFQKGTDPRRNLNGRPKTFKQLRALFVKIASEQLGESDITRAEEMVRRILASDNPSDHALALKYGWGNVPDELEVKESGTIKVKLTKAEDCKN